MKEFSLLFWKAVGKGKVNFFVGRLLARTGNGSVNYHFGVTESA